MRKKKKPQSISYKIKKYAKHHGTPKTAMNFKSKYQLITESTVPDTEMKFCKNVQVIKAFDQSLMQVWDAKLKCWQNIYFYDGFQ